MKKTLILLIIFSINLKADGQADLATLRPGSHGALRPGSHDACFEDAELVDLSRSMVLRSQEQQQMRENTLVGGFTIDSAREIANFADLSYNTDAKTAEIKALERRGYQVIKFRSPTNPTENYGYFDTPDTHAGIVVVQPDGSVVIAYHGTFYSSDIGKDAHCNLVTSSDMYGRFHSGFYHTFLTTKHRVLEIVKSIAQRQGKNVRELSIYCTGHSMGAGIATIASKYLQEKMQVKSVRTLLLASPRALSPEAAEDYDSRDDGRTVSLAEADDPVTMVGPRLFGYQNVGAQVTVPRPIRQGSPGVHRMAGYKAGLDAISGYNRIHTTDGTVYSWEKDQPTIDQRPFILGDTIPNPVYILYKTSDAFHKYIAYPMQRGFKHFKSACKRVAASVKSGCKAAAASVSAGCKKVKKKAKNAYSWLKRKFSRNK